MGGRDRRREARPLLTHRGDPNRLDGLGHQPAEGVSARSHLGLGGRHPVVGGGQREIDVERLLGDVLMDERVGEAGETRVRRPGDHLGLEPVGNPAEDLVDDRGELAHPLTPMRTPENRAGAAGCPVWATWSGWPFPQLGVPQSTHSGSPPTMSRVAQNRGVIPV
jgi:hypothetical protein